MAPQCIICQSEILSRERAEKLTARKPKMTPVQKKNLEEELSKGFMVSTHACGHCFHEECIIEWARAEHQRMCIDVLEEVAIELEETGIMPSRAQVLERLDAAGHFFRCPTCRKDTRLIQLHPVYLNDNLTEDDFGGGENSGTSTPRKDSKCKPTQGGSDQSERNSQRELMVELKATHENCIFLSALLDSLKLLPSALESSSPIRAADAEGRQSSSATVVSGQTEVAAEPASGTPPAPTSGPSTDRSQVELVCEVQVHRSAPVASTNVGTPAGQNPRRDTARGRTLEINGSTSGSSGQGIAIATATNVEQATSSRGVGRGRGSGPPAQRMEPGIQPSSGSRGSGRGRLLQSAEPPAPTFEKEMRRRIQCRRLQIGSLVTYVGANRVPIVGVVRWVGQLPCLPDVDCFGIEFAEPIGDSSGRVGNKVLFDCKPCHGFMATINYLYEEQRFRFDKEEYRVPPGARVEKSPGDFDVGAKVVWVTGARGVPEVGMVNWLGIRRNGRDGRGQFLAGVEFANKIGHPGFNLCPHRPGHARLVHVTELVLFKDYFPMQDDLAALGPKIKLS